MTKFIVSYKHLGARAWYLRSTIVIDRRDEAQQFDSAELAQTAATKAKKFQKSSFAKTALIQRLTEEG